MGELTLEPSVLMMFFNVTNTGKVTVTVSTIYLELPGDQRMLFPWLEGERPLPCRVEAGEKSIFWQRFKETQDKLRDEGYSGSLPIVVVIEDAVGNRYTKQTKFRVSHEEPA
ncbi:MAG: hypothetical protein H0U02_01995 [Rubrobacter sp.]|nr:hypothetical protein [Rubrobacter sp.]